MTTTDDRIDDDQEATVDGGTDTTGSGAADTGDAAPDDAVTDAGSDDAVTNGADDDGQAETFPRAYVEQLRKESAGYRERAQRADQLEQRLHTALVAATGRLADPTDLPFDVAHLDDADALAAAIDELVERKPHLKTRRLSGDVGQGAGGVKAGDVNLADLLRART